MEAPELKPCPFCGSGMESNVTDHAAGFAKDSLGHFAVNCECGAVGPFRDSIERACAAWNINTVTALQEEVDSLRCLLKLLEQDRDRGKIETIAGVPIGEAIKVLRAHQRGLSEAEEHAMAKGDT
ncbi:Lar family restriction alleviation protein [Phaeobacter piscinae]|uniref:Lar family restriction alleviation protein n=1 Tax=Phaeobacter piscinae TaxID=1580596 RepID=UPI000C9C23F3|nr:Lar family restriction alleviation protein [Phaeobacter piscinae]AUQ74796.1 restriction alleviation protein, Lar family [Phaeobacter piscinae]